MKKINTRKEYKREMKRIVRFFLEDENVHEQVNSCDNLCLIECIERDYIRGIAGSKNVNGEYVGSIVNPSVTEKGYDFLFGHPNLNQNLMLICSITAVIISIISLIISCV